MKRVFTNKLLQSSITLFVAGLIFAVPHAAYAGFWDRAGELTADIVLTLPGALSLVLLQILSAVLYLSGVVLNYVADFTIVHMSDRIADAGVNSVWGTLRDVANMGFIFILLFASIQLILGIGRDTQKLIVRIVMVAILINFSLFFTKVVIDASNVLAITFYGAMAPGALEDGFNRGIANSLMEPLKIQTLAKQINGVDGTKMMIIGVLGSVFVLIASFVFIVISILLIIRFVVLIFVLILSPLAFMAMVLPNTKGQFNKWWNALSGQAFFAPIFFLLVWIVISISGKLYNGDGSLGTAVVGSISEDGSSIAPKSGDIGLIVNFFVVIAFLITSLVIAKDWANKAGSGVKDLTKWATGKAGDAAFGTMSFAGRKTFGAYGIRKSQDAQLQEDAYGENAKTGIAGARARLNLGLARKMRSGSFDPRRAVIPTRALGEAIEGTMGRTAFGKKLGLDDVNILQNLEVGAFAAEQTGVGKGKEGGEKERREENKKRVDERKTKAKTEAEIVKKEAIINKGSKPGASVGDVSDMEKLLTKTTDKEIEAIVSSNRDLLDSLKFANAISVKQLETLNKSDKLSDGEKETLKNSRFNEINSAMAPGGGGAAAVGGKIKALADSELDMINPDHLTNVDFVAQLRPSQVDAINKSPKFTSTQKNRVKELRRQPLENAIAAGIPTDTQEELRKLSPKDIAALGVRTATGGPGILVNPLLLAGYTPNMLKRMAQEMNTRDIQILRSALLGPPVAANTDTLAWLTNPDTGEIDFS